MTQGQGETAVTTSALICGGMYLYRKLTEKITRTPSPTPAKVTARGTAAGVLGVGELLPAGTWITGAGVTFIGLSILTSIDATLGGAMAILVATGAVLGNGQAVIADVGQGIERPQLKQAAQTATPATPAAGPQRGNHPPTTSKVR
jgi:hypothetical protein